MKEWQYESGLRDISLRAERKKQLADTLKELQHAIAILTPTKPITTEKIKPKKPKTIRQRLQNVWNGMIWRCYGTCDAALQVGYNGRTHICDDWLNDFENFHKWAILSNYSPGLELDRIDHLGHYCPNNCQWLTKPEHILKSSGECK